MQNKKIAIVYNTSHYIYMFRLKLIEHLRECGYEIFAIAPYDEYSNKLQDIGIKYIPIGMDNKGTNPKNDLKLIYNLYVI